MKNRLENYQQLVKRVEQLCKIAEQMLGDHLNCKEGCSSCCKPITLFPVEAAAVKYGFGLLSDEQAAAVRDFASSQSDVDICPLLSGDRCLIYSFRPIICRTHGLPIMFTENSERRVDYCPKNMLNCKSLPGKAVIDLERLNELLVAVNSLYISQAESEGDPGKRVPILNAILETK